MKIPRNKKASKAKNRILIIEDLPAQNASTSTAEASASKDSIPSDTPTQMWNALDDPQFSPKDTTVDHLFDTYINSSGTNDADAMAVDEQHLIDENGNPWEPEEEMGPG